MKEIEYIHSKLKNLTSQQERFLISCLSDMPSKYSKASIMQCLIFEFGASDTVAGKLTGSKRSSAYLAKKGVNVVNWHDRPEKDRLSNLVLGRLRDGLTDVRIFEIEGYSDVTLITFDGHSPDKDIFNIISPKYVTIHVRQDIRRKISSKKFKELDIILTKYHSIRPSKIKNYCKFIKF